MRSHSLLAGWREPEIENADRPAELTTPRERGGHLRIGSSESSHQEQPAAYLAEIRQGELLEQLAADIRLRKEVFLTGPSTIFSQSIGTGLPRSRLSV
jgi:hypothetical protein